MSDEEFPPMGAEDMSDEDVGGEPVELPEGVKKEIITAAPESEWRHPKKGDDVTVHYVGTLLSDGSQFDSSRDRGTPFVFQLGKGQVIKGWDLGVASMKKGEVAKFTLAPEFAYGDAGSPPKIPEKATLVFEVELISWASKDDLFGDEGVIKTQVKEGSGWKNPKDGEEVRVTVKVTVADAVVEEKTDIEYTLGSGVLGPISKAVDKVLLGMKKGEEAILKCTKDYLYGDERPEGGTIEVALLELYETKDVSFAKDKSLMKKQVKDGDGWDMPKDGCSVKLLVESATDGEKPLSGFTAKTLEFTSGNGEVCDALECAAAEMKKGERAVLTVTKPALAAEEQLGLPSLDGVSKVVLTLELQEFEKAKDTWSMSEEEKVEFGTARKDVGSKLFKEGRVEMALERYKKVGDIFSYTDNFKEENKQKAKELKRVCELNKAACYLKLQQHQEAKKACNDVLKDEAANLKALFRRAQADFHLAEFNSCIRDCKKVLELDPQNREARQLAKQALACQKEEDKKLQGMFAKMCRGIAVPHGKEAAKAEDGASAEAAEAPKEEQGAAAPAAAPADEE